ncbi:MAG TPA: acetyl-CoA carboxylase biotin carboxyl carrier protein [Planctomycetota bacterium]|nr:acetyl-CoA carboxylase biotin carboxyl carrier protein [Planctomycetota bacterium]
MDLRELKKLVALMNESGLVEVEMTLGGERVVVKKAGPQPPPQYAYAPAPMPQAMPAAPVAAAASGGGASAGAVAPRSQADGAVTFNSPMVGTFYASPNPDAPPFARKGDRVTPDTVLCLIEAMKVFNEIKAEMSGEIVDVLVSNQEAVEFNQPLYLIKP